MNNNLTSNRVLNPTKNVAIHENQRLESEPHLEIVFGYTSSNVFSFNTSRKLPPVNDGKIVSILYPRIYKGEDIVYENPSDPKAVDTYANINKIQAINISDIKNAADFGQLRSESMKELLEYYVFCQDTNLTLERNDIKTHEAFATANIDINKLRQGKYYQYAIECVGDEWTQYDLEEWLSYREWFIEKYNVPQVVIPNDYEADLIPHMMQAFVSQEGSTIEDLPKMNQYIELVKGNMQVIRLENEKGMGRVA